MRQEIKEIYRPVPSMYGLALPQDYQHPKQVWFNPLSSGVGAVSYTHLNPENTYTTESGLQSALAMCDYGLKEMLMDGNGNVMPMASLYFMKMCIRDSFKAAGGAL